MARRHHKMKWKPECIFIEIIFSIRNAIIRYKVLIKFRYRICLYEGLRNVAIFK